MSEETKCPKCGAEAFTTNAAITEFHCGSTLYSESFVCRNSGFERFNPSHLCELTTLRAALSKAVEALKPFAKWSERYERHNYEFNIFETTDFKVTSTDLRRASAVIAELSLTRAESGDL